MAGVVHAIENDLSGQHSPVGVLAEDFFYHRQIIPGGQESSSKKLTIWDEASTALRPRASTVIFIVPSRPTDAVVVVQCLSVTREAAGTRTALRIPRKWLSSHGENVIELHLDVGAEEVNVGWIIVAVQNYDSSQVDVVDVVVGGPEKSVSDAEPNVLAELLEAN
jgi:hypothetical protein